MSDTVRRTLPAFAAALLLLLLLTSTGNAQWKKVNNVPPGVFFNEVFFIDSNHGWLTQHLGVVVRTVDGGGTWTSSPLPNSTGSFNRDICFISTQVGFVSGDDGIWKTVDGGASWTNITPPNAPVTGNSSNWFIDANTGVYGFGSCNGTDVRFFRTTNAGATWDSAVYSQPLDVSVGGICYASGAFYAAGGVGNFWKSVDNGANWTLSNTNSGGFAEDAVTSGGAIHLASVDGSVCGVSGGGKTLRSLDGGATWTSVPFAGVLMWGITMYSASEGWSCGDGGHAYKTTDGGSTWTEKSCGMTKTDRIDDIHFTDPTHGWAVGDGVYKYVGDYYEKRPDTIDFGDIVVGSVSSDSNARIKAVGSTLIVTNRAITGPNATQFQATAGLGVQNVASCTDGLTPIRFAPTLEGPMIAQLEYTLAAYPDIPFVILKGRGVKPRIASVTSMAFDTVICGFTGYDTVYVHSIGNVPLKITSAAASSPLSGGFKLISPTPPVTIAPGDSVPFIVQGTTVGLGQLSGALSLASNDPDPGKSPWVISLSMYKRKIAVTFNLGTFITIPPAPLGAKSTICLNYLNSGDGQQTIVSVVPDSGDASITQSPDVSAFRVAKGGSKDICFTASALDTFVHVRRFRVTTDPCGLDTIITVRYQALNPVINSISVWQLTAGACDSIVTDAILVTNKGNAPLILDKPIFGGADGSGFSLTGTTQWPDTIPVGGSHLVHVAYNFGSDLTGTRIGTITFPNNDGLPGKNQWTVSLNVARGSSELVLSRRIIDVGDICLKHGRVEWTRFTNMGTAPAAIRSLDTLVGSAAVSVASTPTAPVLLPNAVDSVAFSVVPRSIGPFSATYVIRYDPCARVDTITVIGRGVGIDLAATPVQLDYGLVQAGGSEQKNITMTNKGTVAATINAWSFTPPIAGAKVIAPGLPLTIDPGQSVPVTVQITPADTGSYELMLTGIAEGACSDTLRAVVTAVAIKGAVTTTRYKIDFGTIASCDNSNAIDSVMLTNKGTSPIDVTGLGLARGAASGFTIVTQLSAPKTLTPGASLPIAVAIAPNASGDLADSLLIMLNQTDQPIVAIPLAAHRDLAAMSVTDTAGAGISTITFATLTQCANSDRAQLRLTNHGSVVDTIGITLTGTSFTLLSPAAILLAPGRDTVVTVRTSMSAPGADDGRLTIQSVPCNLGALVDLHARYETSAASVAGIDFSNIVLGNSIERSSDLANNGGAAQTIDTVYVEDPAGGFTVLGLYRGTQLQAGATLPVRVNFTPAGLGGAATRLVVIVSQPCPDTLYAALNGAGVKDELYPIVLTGGTVRGRWGTVVGIPIAFENKRNASLSGFDIQVATAPGLLDPATARFAHGSLAGWSMTRTGFDATSGTLTLHMAPSDFSALLPTSDTLIVIDYEVLRGSDITSDVKVAVANLPSNVIAQTNPGSFALEDYCDAHGRLLHVQGNVALEQNAPNPFNPETIIEFETAFEGHVVLAVYDGIGREILRPVDEVLPAGRRRIRFDARDLPSGVYTYKLITGLQVLSRQMVVTK